jgi:hypothetical protein
MKTFLMLCTLAALVACGTNKPETSSAVNDAPQCWIPEGCGDELAGNIYYSNDNTLIFKSGSRVEHTGYMSWSGTYKVSGKRVSITFAGIKMVLNHDSSEISELDYQTGRVTRVYRRLRVGGGGDGDGGRMCAQGVYSMIQDNGVHSVCRTATDACQKADLEEQGWRERNSLETCDFGR